MRLSVCLALLVATFIVSCSSFSFDDAADYTNENTGSHHLREQENVLEERMPNWISKMFRSTKVAPVADENTGKMASTVAQHAENAGGKMALSGQTDDEIRKWITAEGRTDEQIVSQLRSMAQTDDFLMNLLRNAGKNQDESNKLIKLLKNQDEENLKKLLSKSVIPKLEAKGIDVQKLLDRNIAEMEKVLELVTMKTSRGRKIATWALLGFGGGVLAYLVWDKMTNAPASASPAIGTTAAGSA